MSTLPGLCAHQVHLASRVEASSLGVGIMPTPKTMVQRIWIFEGVPRQIDMDQARAILEPVFQQLTIIRQVHKGSTKNFIFQRSLHSWE